MASTEDKHVLDLRCLEAIAAFIKLLIVERTRGNSAFAPVLAKMGIDEVLSDLACTGQRTHLSALSYACISELSCLNQAPLPPCVLGPRASRAAQACLETCRGT